MRSTLLRYAPLFLGSWLALGASAAACAPDSGTDATGDADDGDGSGAGRGSTTGSGFEDGATSSTGLNECGGESHEAELKPLMMFITFDKSGSMDDSGKWDSATAALKAFFQDPTAAELEVALRFFPQGQCNENACDVSACAMPQVGVGALTADPAPIDAQEQALVSAIDATSPGGATPISAALEGAIQFSASYLTQHPGHAVVAILVTDGEPNGCEENIGAIANIAAAGLAQGVPSYTVGLQGSNEAQLWQIAMAGGGSSFFVGNGNAQADLLAALQAIRGEALACEIPVPAPTMGSLDPALVNVLYTPGGGGSEQAIGKVDGEGSCGPSGGWYYDDPADPRTIVLCPATCDAVKVDAEGTIRVVLGCESIPG